MYFSRAEFVPNVEAGEEALRNAEQARETALRHFGVELDWTEESLQRLETLLGRVHDAQAANPVWKASVDGFSHQFGSYFGETVRRLHGGTWGYERVYSDLVPALRLDPAPLVLAPVARARGRLADGPREDIWEYYGRVRRAMAGREDAHETTLPAPPLREFYTLRHDQGYFEAGMTEDGRQVLMSPIVDALMVLYFDRDGYLLEYQELPYPVPRHPVSEVAYTTPEHQEVMDAAKDAWIREVGFRPEPIRVRRFSLPDEGIGIEDRPEDDEAFLEAPELAEPDEEARRERLESIQAWDREGCFVLYWGNDLWLNGEGEVTSS